MIGGTTREGEFLPPLVGAYPHPTKLAKMAIRLRTSLGRGNLRAMADRAASIWRPSRIVGFEA
jgi:hypothetical protein